MEEDGVARLSAPFPNDAPVAKPCSVIGLKQLVKLGSRAYLRSPRGYTWRVRPPTKGRGSVRVLALTVWVA